VFLAEWRRRAHGRPSTKFTGVEKKVVQGAGSLRTTNPCAATAASLIVKLLPFLLLTFSVSASAALSAPPKNSKAPSRDQVMWTETDVGYTAEADASWVAPSETDFGLGRKDHSGGLNTNIRHLATWRKLMAFLLHAGAEWQRLELGSNRMLPRSLNSLNAFLATDVRWSEKNMVRLQIQPGYYSDFDHPTFRDINIPFAMAYTRIASQRFQWTVALSYNSWRDSRFLPGGGFRWYMTDRWRFKFILPEPMIEYKASDVVHLSLAADFKGDTYRMGHRFGDERNNPSLNRALLTYQEVRVGPAFSWNVRPLMELKGQAGYMLDRTFDYHNNGIHGSSRPAPFVRLSLRMLFQLVKDTRPVNVQMRAMQYEFPVFNRFFKQ
jgi:hypothetical protein